MAMDEDGRFDTVVAGSHPPSNPRTGHGRQCQQDLLSIDSFTVADQPLILGFQGLYPRQRGQTTGGREHSACVRNPN